MTTEELLRIIRRNADEDKSDPIFDNIITLTIDEMMRVCNVIAAEEREECASICDGHDARYDIPEVRMCADAIRGRNTND